MVSTQIVNTLLDGIEYMFDLYKTEIIFFCMIIGAAFWVYKTQKKLDEDLAK